MSRSVRLRRWQHAALARFNESRSPDFLAVATPGAGKTTFALAALRTMLARRPARVVIVAPTAHLKVQWAQAAERLGLHVDPAWSPGAGGLPRDVHGVVTSYQQVAASAPAIRALAGGAYAVLDEIHHAGEDQAWGESLRVAFGESARRLSLSGTPFRSDTRAIPFVRYHVDEAVPDYEYGYGDALRDGHVVRPVYFPRLGGHMEWAAPDGNVYAATFDDPLAAALANQRLRTALSVDGEWLPTVLAEASARLAEIRRTQPDAAGLVIATDQEHAKAIGDLLRRRFRTEPAIVTSDDPEASGRLAAFAGERTEWLVAVRMVSEGVDVPRLRVGVYATTTTTDLFFRQAVGRFVRWVPGIPDQRAWVYLPDDVRLRIRAAEIAEARRHSLRRDRRPDDERDPMDGDRDAFLPPDAGEQLSLFQALSATPLGGPLDGAGAAPWHEPLPAAWGDGADTTIEVDLGPLPAFGDGSATDGDAGAGAGGGSARERRELLRQANANAAASIARGTGLSHAEVNGVLNRRAGVTRITEATIEQLQARLAVAHRWLDGL